METGDLFILQWTKKSRMHSWVFRRTIQRKNGKTGVRCSSVTWGKPALLSAIQPRTKITIFLLQSSKRFSPLLRHVTEYASFLLTYETLATKGLDSYMGYNTSALVCLRTQSSWAMVLQGDNIRSNIPQSEHEHRPWGVAALLWYFHSRHV